MHAIVCAIFNLVIIWLQIRNHSKCLKCHSIDTICNSICECCFHNDFTLNWQRLRLYKNTLNLHQIRTCVLTASAILHTVQIRSKFINSHVCEFGRKCANLKLTSNLHIHLHICKFNFSSRVSNIRTDVFQACHVHPNIAHQFDIVELVKLSICFP